MPPSTKLLNKRPSANALKLAALAVSAGLSVLAYSNPALAGALYPLAALLFGAGVVRRPGDLAP